MKPDSHDHRRMEGLPTRETDLMSPGELDRRRMLKLMGASMALSMGVAGCDRKPVRRIVSRVDPPEYMHPGDALYYSSTWTDAGFPYGMIVKTVDGRPVAVEGDPDDPVNRGAASAAMKASILSLYDPDRLRAPRRGGAEVSWEEADREIVEALRRARKVVVMTRSTLGPSERALVARLRRLKPGTAHLVHETVHDRPRRGAWSMMTGAAGEIVPRYDRARVILSLGSDFLGTDGPVLEATRQYAAGRQADGAGSEMSRLWVVEGAMTLTGMNADHRIRLKPSLVLPLVQALNQAVAGDGKDLESFAIDLGMASGLFAALARDLREHQGAAVVVAGPDQPPAVHASVALLNEALKAPGRTLFWNPEPPSLPVSSPAGVAAAFRGGADVALLMGVNPVYDFLGGGFAKMLAGATLKVGCGLYADETLAACDWALPSAHALESWNDAAPRPGSTRLCQPVLAPLFEARQEAESLLAWCKALAPQDAELGACEDWHEFIKGRWQKEVLAGATDPQAAWEAALRRGGLQREETMAAPRIDRPRVNRVLAQEVPRAAGLELVSLPHASLFDGRFAPNAWLQELPDPVSRIVWDTGVALSAATAEGQGLAEGDLVEIAAGNAKVTMPLVIQPGMAEGVVALTLGGGRSAGGQVAPGIGASGAPIAGQRFASLSKVGSGHQIVRTQTHFSMEGRPLALDGTLAEYRKDQKFVEHRTHVPEQVEIHEEFTFEGAHWGMSIDMNACTGCSLCVTACQAENNIPVVGKEECANGREMHWLRIDLYRDGDPAEPTCSMQPVTCHHCDNAPCEMVCPVQATSHSPEGLNEMTYNRCVGTRYCANNCPYKVRRFNFFDYQERQLRDPVQELAFNPSVSVRSRGIMEKCTFCVQRINEVRFREKDSGSFSPRDGAIQTACQQACPADAITFGNLNDPASRVSKLRRNPRSYLMLEELNVKPSLGYLARLRNPHPDAPASAAQAQQKGGH